MACDKAIDANLGYLICYAGLAGWLIGYLLLNMQVIPNAVIYRATLSFEQPDRPRWSLSLAK